MKKILNQSFIIFTFLYSLTTFAQDITFTNGDEYNDVINTYDIIKPLGEKDSNTYILKRQSSETVFLQKFDEKLNHVKSVPIIISEQEKHIIEDIILANNKFYLFASLSNKKTLRNDLYVGYLDEDGKISNFNIISTISLKSPYDKTSFHIFISDQKQKICIQQVKKYNKKENEILHVEVFDLDLQSIYKQKINLLIKNKHCEIKKIIIDDHSNIYALVSVYIKTKYRDLYSSDYQFKIISYFPQDDHRQINDIKIEKNVICGIDIQLDNNNNLICGGIFSEIDHSYTKGIFYTKLDKKTHVIQPLKKHLYSPEFLNDLMGTELSYGPFNILFKPHSTKERELKNHQFKNLLISQDGSAYIISEYTSGNNYFGSIAITKIDSLGKFKQNITVQKLQTFQYNNDTSVDILGGTVDFDLSPNETYYLGMYAFTSKNQLYIIYHDNKDNIQLSNMIFRPKTMTEMKNSVLVLVTIPKTNKSKKRVTISGTDVANKRALFSRLDVKGSIIPTQSMKLNEKMLLMYGGNGNFSHLVKLSFDE